MCVVLFGLWKFSQKQNTNTPLLPGEKRLGDEGEAPRRGWEMRADAWMTFTAIACCTLLLAACSSPRDSTVRLTAPDGHTISVVTEVADDDAERERGLMGRTSLQDGHGMVFLFDAEQQLYFWMKDTLIPLDVLYFDADGRYVSAATMPPCQTDPCSNYASARPAKTALEVPAGFVAKNGVGAGWSIELPAR